MKTGFKDYRLKANDDYNKDEIKAIEVFNQPNYIDYADFIVFGQKPETGFEPNDYLNDRELKIVISVVQWLGTPVGKSFLREIGSVDTITPDKIERLYNSSTKKNVEVLLKEWYPNILKEQK